MVVAYLRVCVYIKMGLQKCEKNEIQRQIYFGAKQLLSSCIFHNMHFQLFWRLFTYVCVYADINMCLFKHTIPDMSASYTHHWHIPTEDPTA